MALPKAFLDRMQFSVEGQAFDRRHGAIIRLNGEERARFDGLAIEQDSARAANARFTSDVRAGQSAPITKKMHQECPRIDFVLLRGTIDADVDGRIHRCCLANCALLSYPERDYL